MAKQVLLDAGPLGMISHPRPNKAIADWLRRLLLAYDALGRLVAERDPRNNITRYEYDQRHRLTKILAPLGSTTSFVYDAAGQLTSLIDAEGRATGYTYDDAGRLSQLTLPAAGEGLGEGSITYQYDTASNLRLVTDQLGRETEFQYDDQHRLVAEILPPADPAYPNQRPTTTYEYFADGQLASMSEAVEILDFGGSLTYLNRTITWEYDAAGRLASVFLPSSSTGQPTHEWQYVNDEFGDLVKVTDPLGNRTEYQYDDLHRLVKVIGEHPDDNQATGETGRPVTQYVYDDAGQLLEMTEKLTDSTSRTTSYVYDGLGRLIRSVQPDPSDGSGIYSGGVPGTPDSDTPFMDYTYDAAGNMLSMKDSASLGTSYAYDALHRRVSETDANGDATSYTYDRVGNLLSLTDPVGNVTSWQYDPLDRVERETNELGHARVFTYDLVGNLTERVDRNGRVIEYDYDDLDRVTTESWFADEQDVTADREINFTYYLLERLLRSYDPDHDYIYSYDYRDLSSIEQSGIAGLTPAVAFQHVYDAVGNLTTVDAFIGSTIDFRNTYAYDNLHRTTSVTQQKSPFGTPNEVAPKRVDLTYDLAGQFDTITRYSDAAGTQAVAVSQYTFDKAGRLDELAHYTGDDPQTGTLLAGYGYTWNQRSQLTAIDFLPSAYDDEDVTYDYDNRHQLEGADYAGLSDESYAYDENGNRISGSFTVGDNNRLLSDGTYDYEYDNEGNRTKRTEIATGNYTLYAWDHRNRLIAVLEMDANGTPTNFGDDIVVHIVANSYDADNQWVKRIVDPDGTTGSAPLEKSIFVWLNGQIVLQFDKTGNGDLAGGDLSHRYLWGPALDQLFADEQVDWSDSDADGPVYWGLTDHLGTVRDVIDNSATVVDHAQYDAFGNRLNAAAVDFLFGFTGKPFDENTGLQYNLNRWYDPTVGRWLSEDPIGFEADDANLGRYVGNSPTMFVDQDGLAKNRVWKIWNGLKVLVDNDTAEFVLENGRRIKIRNAKFIDCDVSLSDLEKLTDVAKETIAKLRKKYGDLSIRFDRFGQPDFSKLREAWVRIPNPGASNYADQAWKVLKEKLPDVYNKLHPRRDQFIWHHAADGRLELLDKNLHTAFQHTGLSSILNQLGCVVVGAIPGGLALQEGRLNDAAREVAVEVSPLGWGSFITDYFTWLFDSAWKDIYGDKPQASEEQK